MDKGLKKGVEKALNPYVDEATSLAAEFVRAARERFGADVASYDLDAVRTLDKVCRFNRAEFDDGLVLQAGFYLGEVLRRKYKSKYQWDVRLQALSLRLADDLAVFPIEKVRKIVNGGDPGLIEEYLLIVARKLADRGVTGSAHKPAKRRGRQ